MTFGRFKVNNNIIALNDYKLTIRHYNHDKTKYDDKVLYLDSDGVYEWEVNRVPKHSLWEIIEKEELSGYEWMKGLSLKTFDYEREISEIAAYGSLEAYQASLPEVRDEYLLDLEYRVCMIELGVNG